MYGRRSPSSSHRRSGGILKNWRQAVLHPIADAFQLRLSGKHCRIRSWRWRVTKNADFTTVCTKSNGETRCNGHTGERGKCKTYPSGPKGKPDEGSRASEKPAALFSSESGEQGTLIFCVLIRRIWEDLFLKAIKTSQARSDLMKQELQVESLNNCISEASATNLCSKIRITGRTTRIYWISTRTSPATRRITSLKEKVLRDTQIRSMHEMGEIKIAQELRVDEVSVQKIGENRETIQQLTSQLQQMQEQMNSMNDSGDFQDVESNYSGRLSHVSSQPAIIPSSRSMLSRDKRLPLNKWNSSGLQENAFGNQFSAFDSFRDHHQRTQSGDVQRERGAVPCWWRDGDYPHKWWQTKSRHNSNAYICNKAVDYEFYISGEITTEL